MISLNLKIQNRLRMVYVLTDLLTSSLAILFFNYFRYQVTDVEGTFGEFYRTINVWSGQIFFPIALLGLYWLSGYYNDVYRRSRAQELILTLSSALLGTLIIFFLAVVNDAPWQRVDVFERLAVTVAIIFVCVYCGRFLITRTVVRAVHDRNNTDAAVMLGTDADAYELAHKINSLRKGMGINVVAFARLTQNSPVDSRCRELEIIARRDVRRYCADHAITNLILTPRAMADGVNLADFMRLAYDINGGLLLSPDLNTVALASGRQFNVVGEPLVCISSPSISASTTNVKRLIDVIASILALILLSPLFAVIGLIIKLDSPGPVFFRQKRLGRGGRPFSILKFRSMVREAESDGHAHLTVDDDPRITRFGRILRKYRLDELPQFVNVIRGEMSLVGPRPERREFADQIADRVPIYPMIYQVRPGITSWGMVRYGYASSVDEMVERLRYDLIYLESISISTDLKILLHTVNTVLSGRGK